MKRRRPVVHAASALALAVAAGGACDCQNRAASPRDASASSVSRPPPPPPAQPLPPAGPATARPRPEATAAPTGRATQPESYEEGWRAFLTALQSGDPERVRSRCTEAGYQSLLNGMGDDEEPATVFKRWGQGWSDWESRWVSTTPTRAQGSMGPEIKAHGIWLVKEGPVWRLERWAPGK